LAAITPHASGRYIVSQPSSLSAHSFTDILKVILLHPRILHPCCVNTLSDRHGA
jgi:hypothetical protein